MVVTVRLRDCEPPPHDVLQLDQAPNDGTTPCSAHACSLQRRVSRRLEHSTPPKLTSVAMLAPHGVLHVDQALNAAPAPHDVLHVDQAQSDSASEQRLDSVMEQPLDSASAQPLGLSLGSASVQPLG